MIWILRILRLTVASKNRTRRHVISTRDGLCIAILLFMAVTFVLYTHVSLLPQDLLVPQEHTQFSGVYHDNWEAFELDYGEMERNFKVFVYPDGDKDSYYYPPRSLEGKYASEGYFFKNLRESQFLTGDPYNAHLFLIPISCHKLRKKVSSYVEMAVAVQKYVESLIHMYPYWNRTLGADHFFVTCHDIGVMATERVPLLAKNSIRVVCSSSYDALLKLGFIPRKDITLPQIRQPFAHPAGGSDLQNRSTLGFWAGKSSSNNLRKILISIWRNDTELYIQNRVNISVTGHKDSTEKLYRSKFCICPAGDKFNTICMADSIHYGCVPVILADQFVLPFVNILDWRKFSVFLGEKDVYNLKRILQDIRGVPFLALHENVVEVQKHFEWNSPPKMYDAFHMVMYELWLRRHIVKY